MTQILLAGTILTEYPNSDMVLDIGGVTITLTKNQIKKAIADAFDEGNSYDMGIDTEALFEDLSNGR